MTVTNILYFKTIFVLSYHDPVFLVCWSYLFLQIPIKCKITVTIISHLATIFVLSYL